MPLLVALAERKIGNIVLTVTTPTGRAEALRQRAQNEALGQSITVYNSPLDSLRCVRRFLRRARPSATVLTESEIWPSAVIACQQAGIPIALLNARISETTRNRAIAWYWIGSVMRWVLANVQVVVARSTSDLHAFRQLGVSKDISWEVPEMKFNLRVEHASALQRASEMEEIPILKSALRRPLIIAGSTNYEETKQVLQVWQQLGEKVGDGLLVLAPRHPENFPLALKWAEQFGQPALSLAEIIDGHTNASDTTSREADDPARTQAQPRVLVLDLIGWLTAFYSRSRLSFVGDSMYQGGKGHNMAEAAISGTLVIIGPYHSVFMRMAEILEEEGALQVVEDWDGFQEKILTALSTPQDSPDQQLEESTRERAERVYALGDKALQGNLKGVLRVLELAGSEQQGQARGAGKPA